MDAGGFETGEGAGLVVIADTDLIDKFNSLKSSYHLNFELTHHAHPDIKNVAKSYVVECDGMEKEFTRMFVPPERPSRDAPDEDWEDYTDAFMDFQGMIHYEMRAQCHGLWNNVYHKRVVVARWHIAFRVVCIVKHFEKHLLSLFAEVHYRPGGRGAAAAAEEWGALGSLDGRVSREAASCRQP